MLYTPTSKYNYKVIHWSASRLPDYAEAFLLQEEIDKRDGKKYYENIFYNFDKIVKKYFGKENI